MSSGFQIKNPVFPPDRFVSRFFPKNLLLFLSWFVQIVECLHLFFRRFVEVMPSHTLNRTFERAEAHVAGGRIDRGNAEPRLTAACLFQRVDGRDADFRELRFQLFRDVRQFSKHAQSYLLLT